MVNKRNSYLLICVLIFVSNVYSQNKNFSVSFRVEVDETKTVESYVGRELRSLGDVEVKDFYDPPFDASFSDKYENAVRKEFSDYRLIIYVRKIQLKNSEVIGYNITFLIFERDDCRYSEVIEVYDTNGKKEKKRKFFAKTFYKHIGTLSGTVTTDSLRTAVENLMTNFDSEYLKEIRKYKQKSQ